MVTFKILYKKPVFPRLPGWSLLIEMLKSDYFMIEIVTGLGWYYKNSLG